MTEDRPGINCRSGSRQNFRLCVRPKLYKDSATAESDSCSRPVLSTQISLSRRLERKQRSGSPSPFFVTSPADNNKPGSFAKRTGEMAMDATDTRPQINRLNVDRSSTPTELVSLDSELLQHRQIQI